MQAVPATLHVGGFAIINPWKFFDDSLLAWTKVADILSATTLQVLRPNVRKAGSTEADAAHEQFKHVQRRLYERHLKRYNCRMDVSFDWECARFCRWSERHSENFRHLLFLYQIDWFKRYSDITAHIADENERIAYQSPELERLFREIESHLYQ